LLAAFWRHRDESAVKFSQEFNVVRTPDDDWFDSVLTVDTRLFLDPFLIYAQPFDPFQQAHSKMVVYFNSAFKLVAESQGNAAHPSWIRAVDLLMFPEVSELCLGFSAEDVDGAGAAKGFAKHIAAALWEAVQSGLSSLKHFEEVGLLRKGIGADRIGDMTGNILRGELATYTQTICARHGIFMEPTRYPRVAFSTEFNRWIPGVLDLPVSVATGKPILLAPETFLRDLPTISGDAFWGHCFDTHNEVLRAEFGADIARHVDKESIINLARRHPEFREEFIREAEDGDPAPYDLKRDPLGRVRWYETTLAHCVQNPLSLGFSTSNEFHDFVFKLIAAFRVFVEDNGGWRLLWNDTGRPKSEEAAQLLFLGIVKHYCAASEVSVAKESDLGRGPSDFTFAQGHTRRTLIEAKLAKNSRFWHGLEKQLPTYMRAEGIQHGVFLVILLSDRDLKRLVGIRDVAKHVSTETGYDIKVEVVDATTEKPSASKVP
jgi:hypothetical protein